MAQSRTAIIRARSASPNSPAIISRSRSAVLNFPHHHHSQPFRRPEFGDSSPNPPAAISLAQSLLRWQLL
jgi:hypothetical protein